MLKKLTSFLLSLLLCLSLLPGQACAAGEPDSPQPPAVVEPLDPEAHERGAAGGQWQLPHFIRRLQAQTFFHFLPHNGEVAAVSK